MTAFTWNNGAGTGLWNNGGNWAGGSGADYPGSTATSDTATFNATSNTACSLNITLPNALGALTLTTGYTQTVTNNAAQTATAGTVTCTTGTLALSSNAFICTTMTINGGTLNSGSGSHSCGGNWTRSSGTHTVGTSTWAFTANGTINPNTAATSDFYSFTINNGVTTTIASTYYTGVLTVNGTLNYLLTSSYVAANSALATPLVFGVGYTLNVTMAFQPTVDYNIPSGTYGQGLATNRAGITGTLAGNIVANGYNNGGLGAYTGSIVMLAGDIDTSASNYSITCQNQLDMVGASTFLLCNGSSITLQAGFRNYNAASYINFGTSSWSVAGSWTNISTSASWNRGTSTINFNGTGAQTLGLNNGASANITYYNITVSGAHTTNSVTWGSGTITIKGALTCTATFTSGTINCATNDPLLVISGGISLASGTLWTKSDGSGTITLDASQTLSDSNATKQDLGVVKASGTITITVSTALTLTSFQVTSGTVTVEARFVYSTLSNSGTWTWLIDGTKGAILITLTTLTIDTGTTLKSYIRGLLYTATEKFYDAAPAVYKTITSTYAYNPDDTLKSRTKVVA